MSNNLDIAKAFEALARIAEMRYNVTVKIDKIIKVDVEKNKETGPPHD
ncbi:MAG: hypothetical protein RR255_05345 [Bacilli bacterium]